MNASTPSRRTFLKTFAAGTAGAGLAASMPAASYDRIRGANERVRLGFIGVGRMARGHLDNVAGFDDAQVVALADVYQPNLRYAAARVRGVEQQADYRALLDRDDIDAVVVASPDHWHALQTIHACEAGKDVYVEKPISLTIAEGRRMVEAARKHDRIVQVGTQQRSGAHFRQAAEIVQSGRLGPISFVRTWNYGNDAPEGIGNPPDSAPPPGLDWDTWLGPAPWNDFNINRFGVVLDDQGQYQRWASFRWFWDYAGGMMTDWGVHLLDIVHLAMQVDAPSYVSAVGGKFVLQDNRETPDTITASYQFSDFACIYENRVANAYTGGEAGYGITFHGSDATLFVNRGGYWIKPEGERGVEPVEVDAEGGSHAKHMRDFLDSVKSRETPVNDIEIGHRSTSTAILGNLAYRLGRGLRWDAAGEKILDDPEANAMLDYTYRSPYAH